MTARAQILIRAVDETRAAFGSIQRNLGGLLDAARRVNGVLAGLGVALSAAGLGAMVKSALDSADALNKLSQRMGITVESLSTLVPAAELSGVSAQTFETGLKKLATTMFEAATGSAECARRRSGVSAWPSSMPSTACRPRPCGTGGVWPSPPAAWCLPCRCSRPRRK